MIKGTSYYQYLKNYTPGVLRKYQAGFHGVLG